MWAINKVLPKLVVWEFSHTTKVWRGASLIELTRMNGKKFTLNCEMIEKVEDTPDTVVTLASGKMYIVQESRQDVTDLVLLYKKEIFSKN